MAKKAATAPAPKATPKAGPKATPKGKPKMPGKGTNTGKTINGFPIYRFKVADLLPADYNPREIRDHARTGLAASVGEFGLVEAIVWNAQTGQMVGGHQRCTILPQDGETEVVVVDLDPTREKALNVALNNPHIQGEWTAALAQVLDDVRTELPELADGLLLDELQVDIPDFGEGPAEGDLPTGMNVGGAGPGEDNGMGGGGAPAEAAKVTCPSCGHAF